jgi:hypothetical protein
MALDATKPTDQELVSNLPYWIRLLASAINTLTSGSLDITSLSVAIGDTTLTVGTDLSVGNLEIVMVTGLGTSTLEYIYGGLEGQVKIFIFLDNDVSIKDGVASGGKFYLNQLPVLSTFNAQARDVLAIVNIGGDGASVYGYWKEIYRQVAVK